jgi:hypothetical protein
MKKQHKMEKTKLALLIGLTLSSSLFSLLLVEGIPHSKTTVSAFPDNYANVSKAIIEYGKFLFDNFSYAFQNTNLSGMAYMCDTFGPRYRGTENLEVW